MSSPNPNPGSGLDSHPIPTFALKQALCYFCWDISSNLRRCTACKPVSYCSVQCQKQDWDRNHKKICKELVVLNKQKGYMPSTDRHWDEYCDEQVLDWTRSRAQNPSELGALVGHEPYCYHCYRRESQLEDGAKLNFCRYCLLHFLPPNTFISGVHDFARSCSRRKSLGRSPPANRKELDLCSQQISQKATLSSLFCNGLGNDSKERRFVEYMRCGTNTTTISLTLLAALEATMPNIGTRDSINLHIIGAAGFESTACRGFEELSHLLPSLTSLKLSFVGLTAKNQDPHTVKCCTMCTRMGRSISITSWKGRYHAYVDTDLYTTPDLAVAFNSGFSVDEQADWYPTVKYLAHAPHPTLFTAARNFEIQGEMEIWKNLGAEFVKNAEVNKWNGMSPSLVVCGDKPNEVIYKNHWWYIVKQR